MRVGDTLLVAVRWMITTAWVLTIKFPRAMPLLPFVLLNDDAPEPHQSDLCVRTYFTRDREPLLLPRAGLGALWGAGAHRGESGEQPLGHCVAVGAVWDLCMCAGSFEGCRTLFSTWAEPRGSE